MFEAKVYKVSIVSSGITLAEEHFAQEVIERWNREQAEEKQIVFIPFSGIPNGEADLYVFPIDNFVDAAKVEAAIETTSPVLLLFNKSHDPDNTMSSELEDIRILRSKLNGRCTCVDYNGPAEFKNTFAEVIQSYQLYI